jgi:hypothetical protein
MPWRGSLGERPPNGAPLSLGRGRLFTQPGSTPALWRSVCPGRAIGTSRPPPCVATKTTAARVESGSGSLSVEGGDRVSAPLVVIARQVGRCGPDQRSAAPAPTHSVCQSAILPARPARCRFFPSAGRERGAPREL